MARISYADKERHTLLIADKFGFQLPDDIEYAHCPNSLCDAHMKLKRVKGKKPFFSASNAHPHIKGCPYGCSKISDFSPADYNLNFNMRVLFDELLDGMKPSGQKFQNSGSHRSNSPTLKKPSKLAQSYLLCKSFDPSFDLGHMRISQSLLDSRSISYSSSPRHGRYIVECYPQHGNFFEYDKLDMHFVIKNQDDRLAVTLHFHDKQLFRNTVGHFFEKKQKKEEEKKNHRKILDHKIMVALTDWTLTESGDIRGDIYCRKQLFYPN